MKNTDTEPKQPTADQLHAARKAIAANPKIKIALDAAGLTLEQFALHGEATLENLAAIHASRR